MIANLRERATSRWSIANRAVKREMAREAISATEEAKTAADAVVVEVVMTAKRAASLWTPRQEKRNSTKRWSPTG